MCAWYLAVQYGGRGEKRIYCLGIQHGIRCAISEISGTGGTQQAIVEFKELSWLQTPRFMMVPAVQGPSEMPLMDGPLRRERDGNLRIRSNGIGAAIRVYRTHHDSRTGLRISEASCCVAEGARLFQDLHGGPLVFQPEDGPAMSTGSRREASRLRKTAPCRPWLSMEYRRTLTSGKSPNHGMAGPEKKALRDIWKAIRPT